jgi:hypothetical protein
MEKTLRSATHLKRKQVQEIGQQLYEGTKQKLEKENQNLKEMVEAVKSGSLAKGGMITPNWMLDGNSFCYAQGRT